MAENKRLTFVSKRIYQFHIIRQWNKRNKNLTITQLAKKLSISRSTLYKAIKLEKTNEIHFKRDYSNNKIKNTIRNRIVSDCVRMFESMNKFRAEIVYTPTFKWLYQNISNAEDVSLSAFVNILKENLIYVKSCSRKTKRNINFLIKRQRQKKKLAKHDDLIGDFLVDQEEIVKPIYLRAKKGTFGYSVEIDACQHDWTLNNEKQHFYHAIDSFTGKLLSIHLEKEETALGYLALLRKLFKKYGTPKVIITDRRKCFWNNVEANSEIARIIKALGIEVRVSSNPRSKPNVERSFKNTQQLFIAEIQKNGWNNYGVIGQKLDWFIDKYNEYYNKSQTVISEFIPVDEQLITATLNLVIIRTVLAGNYLAINNRHYGVQNNANYRIPLPPKTKVKILMNELENYHIYCNNQKYYLEELTNTQISNALKADKIRIKKLWEQKKQWSYTHTFENKINALKASTNYWKNKCKELSKSIDEVY